MLPDLSRLDIGAPKRARSDQGQSGAPSQPTLHEFLVAKGVAKNGRCVGHFAIRNPDKKADPANDADVNCAIDGYLMWKAIADTDTPAYTTRNGAIELEVQLSQLRDQPAPPLQTARLVKWLGGRVAQTKKSWFEKHFPGFTAEDDGTPLFELICGGKIEWRWFGEELAASSDFFFLNPDIGMLFVAVCGETGKKQQLHLPFEAECAVPFLYVSLVCSKNGRGRHLLEIAQDFAKVMGCSGILLSSLEDPAGFYFGRDFNFVTRRGTTVPVDMFVQHKEGKRILQKTVQQPPQPPQPPQSAKRARQTPQWMRRYEFIM